MVDVRKVKKLIELLEESELTEIEISEGEESIRLSRTTASPQNESPSITTSVTDTSETISGPSGSSSPNVVEDLPEASQILSPMVGTYYAAPNPETPPFAKVGSEIAIGDTLCIIEAMKIFNHVEADCAGIVRKILKSSGDPVEFGEILFLIEPLSHDMVS